MSGVEWATLPRSRRWSKTTMAVESKSIGQQALGARRPFEISPCWLSYRVCYSHTQFAPRSTTIAALRHHLSRHFRNQFQIQARPPHTLFSYSQSFFSSPPPRWAHSRCQPNPRPLYTFSSNPRVTSVSRAEYDNDNASQVRTPSQLAPLVIASTTIHLLALPIALKQPHIDTLVLAASLPTNPIWTLQ